MRTILKVMLLLGLSVSSVFAVLDTSEKQALLGLYTSAGGANWTHSWNNRPHFQFTDPCEQNWYGVTCNSGNTHVLKLDLTNNGLSGYIHPSLGNLTHLEKLTLGKNKLVGIIPFSLGNLTHLTRLSLGGNNIIGSIPSSLGNLSNLEFLYLWGNQLTGNIPTSLGKLKKLKNIDIGSNRLTGTIPSSFGDLTRLRSLKVGSNKLTGTIPSSLSLLPQLTTLHIDHNSFYGPLDTDLASTLSTKLRIDYNYFTNIEGLSALPADTHLILNKNCIRDFTPLSHLANVHGENDQYEMVTFNLNCQDWDDDGIPSGIDPDWDNDGVANTNDAFPYKDSESLDTDGDGIGNNADTDDDNDGISDSIELANGLDPLDADDGAADEDGDGFSNAIELSLGTNMHNASSKPGWTPILMEGIMIFVPFKP